ncbi:thrombospondin-2-like [Mytilus trossulus]|uniref:thrombospondin-2-like n=1 Tax=Mytilus trossulus TaxID=6551 RepID=UPI0030056C84
MHLKLKDALNYQVGQSGVPARDRVPQEQGHGVGNAAPVFGVVHGSWSSYDPWNNCPVTCGGTSNNQHRSRYCNKPQPSCGGSTCSGTSKQYQICNSSPCPVDGQWSEWSSYGSCPVTCGSGAHSRYRTCNNPSPANGGASCKGLDTEYTMCWSGECPVHGGWSEWSKFSACPVTCGGGTNTRTRTCDNPTPEHGGNNCVGASSENGVCNTQACPDIDDCISVDCLHGGKCVDKLNAYSCECVPGFAGHHCELGFFDRLFDFVSLNTSNKSCDRFVSHSKVQLGNQQGD